MDQFNYLNKTPNVKDNEKGHKIAAALYLVSQHLSDTDPLKSALRTQAVALISPAHDGRQAVVETITALLETASLAQLISEKNTSIILLELRHYMASMESQSSVIAGLFTPVLNPVFSKTPLKTNLPVVKSPVINDNKAKRQDAILSFINERKSAGIKDIAALFSDTSEKTIQRELGALVSAGKITKRGEKRWSVYMSV